jgi:hypothetical protein
MAPTGGRRPATRGVFAIEEPELDTGFALLPASLLRIYTDRSRLASCRAKRPR